METELSGAPSSDKMSMNISCCGAPGSGTLGVAQTMPSSGPPGTFMNLTAPPE
jgi:hypothetical protein